MFRKIKAKFAILLSAILCVSVITSVDTSVYAEKEIVPILFAEIVDGQNGEHFLNNPALDMEKLGPKSFAISNGGDIYILDTLNYKIKLYNKKGNIINYWDLPNGGGQFIDMEITDSLIYVLNEHGETFSINLLSKKDTWDVESKQIKENVIGLYTDEGNVIAKKWNGIDENLTSKNKNTPIVSKNVNGNSVELKTDNSHINVKYVAQPIGTYIAKSNKQVSYVIEQEVLLGYYPYAETRVGKYVDGTKTETALTISTGDYEYSIPFKKVYLTQSGEVYQMVPTKNSIKIYNIQWNLGYATRITNEMIELDNKEPELVEDPEANTRAMVSKNTALDRANNMCYMGWWYNGHNK